MSKREKGQSILEYVIILTVIVAAIAYAASQYIKPAVVNGLNNAASSINTATNNLP